ncbi:hypothetical protein ABZP36_023971 [Zizania latifolia]
MFHSSVEQHRVMSVYGMVGIGKTTLVRSVYESQEISSLFKQRAWVTISHPFNLHDILASLPRELDAQSYSLFGSGTQSSRRCLIVLDDVLCIEEWNFIHPHLPEDTSTYIIVITREASVAKHCSTTNKNIYKLEYLEDNEALELFKNKVFMGSSDIDLNADMITQAKLITNQCDGHPLAITTIAGFLARKPKTTMEWKKMNDDFSAGSGSNPNHETISRALAPSYDDVPYHLKLCHLYLCVFPKGHNIRRKRLFYLHPESPSCATSSKQLLPRGTIAKQMRSLRNQIKQVNKSSELYCKAISSLDDAAAVPSQPNTGPTVADNSRNAPLVGRVKEKSHLIQLISQDDEQHRVISVWGMVGIGKTTLVSSVYESQEISSLFEQPVWVTISHHPFDLHGILSSLAREIDAQNVGVPAGNDTQSNFDAISAKIKTSSRSCLIVLDDVVSIEEWNLIQPQLPEDTSTHHSHHKGSRSC